MIRIGIIGNGYWGQKHVRIFRDLQGCQLEMIGDTDRDRGVSPEMVLASEVDAVVIATPAKTHYDLALRALLEGKHVLCEKPLTLSAPDAQHLVIAARNAGKVLMTGHTYLFNPQVAALRDRDVAAITTTRRGGVYREDCPPLWDLGAHDVSICNYIFGGEPFIVSADRGAGCFMLTYESGSALCSVKAGDGPKVRRVVALLRSGSRVEINDENYSGPEPLRVECQHFLDAIGGADYISGAEFSLGVVRTLERLSLR